MTGLPTVLFVALLSAATTSHLRAEESPASPPSDQPRDAYNSGTKELKAGKLTEAEEALETSVAGQQAAIQPIALYNLGCVRVAEGVDLLKKSKDPGGRASKDHVDTMTSFADDSRQAIDAAIASQNEQDMVSAYIRGRGVHREINTATKAVRKALDAKKDILAKWQRAAGDFRSAAELKKTDQDATYNAEVMEKSIAALIDKLDQLQQAAMKMKMAGQQLGQKLAKLKGMMPMPDAPPGGPGDDDDDQDMPGTHPGEKEGAGKTGEEQKISPEEAQQMLAGYKLGADRKLPLGQESTAKPKDHPGKDW